MVLIVDHRSVFFRLGRQRASEADHLRGQRQRRRLQLTERAPCQPHEDGLQRGGREDRATVSGEP